MMPKALTWSPAAALPLAVQLKGVSLPVIAGGR
jgi:hypothetical protein